MRSSSARPARTWAAVAAAGVLALGLSACSTVSPASAARPAAPGPGHDSELQSVSCAGPASCWAVGFSSPDQQAAVVHTLVESYSGRRWSLWPAPSPGPRSLLFGVSCRTRRFCQAVGSTAPSSSSVVPDAPPVPQVPLAERFDGTRWLMEPAPALGMGRLQGVSCPTTTFCVAVGQRDNSTALIEQWNGRSWTTMPTGLPAGTSDLQAVSCPTQRRCVAVGSQQQSTLIDIESHGRWQVTPSPNGPAASYSTLSGVSCSEPSSCTAVGSSYVSKTVGTVPLSVTYNRTSWSAVAGQRPGSGKLQSVTCPSTRTCVAVGVTFQHPDGANLIEMFDASGPTQLPTDDPSATQPGLAGVACAAPGRCVAVGSHYAGSSRYLTSVEMSHGNHWTVDSSPNVTGT